MDQAADEVYKLVKTTAVFPNMQANSAKNIIDQSSTSQTVMINYCILIIHSQ